ncbi:guanine nucleotide exchange protein for ADP-robosylation factor [Globomyces sp. JEL0801]|nr:guanine nucleotide exchange protein for ADP-robosylation factor [Globomyces sp. JEL0801]
MGGTDNATNQAGGFFKMFGAGKTETPVQKPVAMPNLNNNSSEDFFIRMSLDLLQNSKDYKRNEQFRAAIKNALDALDRPNEASNSLAVFKPFQIACQSGSPELITIAIDCLGKLFSYNYWKNSVGIHLDELKEKNNENVKKDSEEDDGDNGGTSEMISFVIDTICDSFVGEITDEKVQLQIIKALQAALTTTESSINLHGSTLLKAIRTTYNIFLLSKSNDVQIVAQGTVTQMVQSVFSRIPNPKQPQGINKRQTVKGPTRTNTVNQNVGINRTNTVNQTPGINRTNTVNQPGGLNRTNTVNQSGNGSPGQQRSTTQDSLRSRQQQKSNQPNNSPTKDVQIEITVENQGMNFSEPKQEEIKSEPIQSTNQNLNPVANESTKREMAVFFTEIILPILEAKKTIPWYQRHALLKSLQKVFSDPEGGRMLVEIYLNYDCDVEATAKENIWERMMNAIAKITSQHVESTNVNAFQLISSFAHPTNGTPALTTSNLVALRSEQVKELFSLSGDAAELRKQGVKLMGNAILKPLVEWCNERIAKTLENETSIHNEELSGEIEVTKSLGLLSDENPNAFTSTNSFVLKEDDPLAIGNLKLRKQQIIEGIKKFNAKPKKGIQYLLDNGCIPARTPRDIAHFLISTEGLSKQQIGDFLGEGEEENIAIMHAFVDQMEFTNQKFIDAIRTFLQSFRLPGEAQKIDRYMLKFAEVYLKTNPSNTAYVLAYSVVMLNTDQHNAQVKKKMSKAEFIKNNRGIDGGKDLPEGILTSIFDEISTNEIIMKDEKPPTGVVNEKKTNDPQAALTKTTGDMALKTEAKFSNILRKGTAKRTAVDEKQISFIAASHYAHLKPMFESIWMSVLTGVSTPLQESDDVETIMSALEGIKNAIRISCIFDMDLEKQTLLSTLSKFTLLNNIQEMRAKNFEAIKTLLEIAFQEGDHLQTSWKDVVTCVSQLEKLQIVGGLNSDETTTRARKNSNTEIKRMNTANGEMKRKDTTKDRNVKTTFLEEAAAEASSQSMTLSVDRIFTASPKLSGNAIVHFVRALCDTSWDEISTSVDKDHPRMYCLQRLVEISYYNMKRIRVEWTNIWAILGEHFNQVGCYPNTTVAFFAIDKLRQLAMKFLEIEELPNFKFQKDFLRPFEEIVKNNNDPKIKDMCLVCLQQLIQIKGKSLKSGWKTLCGTLMRVSRDTNEQIVNLSFELVTSIFKLNFDNVLSNGSLPDFVACLVEFCKNRKTAKVNLYAVELLRQCIQKISEIVEAKNSMKANIGMNTVTSPSRISVTNAESPATVTKSMTQTVNSQMSTDEDVCIRLWMPLLFGLHDIIMTCDLEVRTRALQYLFETLKTKGSTFSTSFWEILAKGVLFPIFDDMKQSSNNTNMMNSKFANKEDLQIWLSTTLIQAFRQFVDLFTHYYNTLGFMLGNMFELLKICILHENEALSRIGSTCIQQLVEHNFNNFNEKGWDLLCNLFTELFQETSPTFLFFDYNKTGMIFDLINCFSESTSIDPTFAFLKRALGPPPDRKEFQKNIAKCIVHLLVVQTLQDVLSTGPDFKVYKAIPNPYFLRLLDCFEYSYIVAHQFNGCLELRQALFKLGYMKQLPNLLKQETLSVNAYVIFLFKIYCGNEPERNELVKTSQDRLIPLCLEILDTFNSFDSEANQRNVTSWKPVVSLILSSISKFDEVQFKQHIQRFYLPTITLVLHELPQDIRTSAFSILQRAGLLYSLIKPEDIKGHQHVSDSTKERIE